jgi:hypothetical protein
LWQEEDRHLGRNSEENFFSASRKSGKIFIPRASATHRDSDDCNQQAIVQASRFAGLCALPRQRFRAKSHCNLQLNSLIAIGRILAVAAAAPSEIFISRDSRAWTISDVRFVSLPPLSGGRFSALHNGRLQTGADDWCRLPSRRTGEESRACQSISRSPIW